MFTNNINSSSCWASPEAGVRGGQADSSTGRWAGRASRRRAAKGKPFPGKAQKQGPVGAKKGVSVFGPSACNVA